jgi:hypothetical protein
MVIHCSRVKLGEPLDECYPAFDTPLEVTRVPETPHPAKTRAGRNRVAQAQRQRWLAYEGPAG